jgi:hypothetical protein
MLRTRGEELPFRNADLKVTAGVKTDASSELSKVEETRDHETVPSADITRCEARHGSDKKISLQASSFHQVICLQGVPSSAMHAFNNSMRVRARSHPSCGRQLACAYDKHEGGPPHSC